MLLLKNHLRVTYLLSHSGTCFCPSRTRICCPGLQLPRFCGLRYDGWLPAAFNLAGLSTELMHMHPICKRSRFSWFWLCLFHVFVSLRCLLQQLFADLLILACYMTTFVESVSLSDLFINGEYIRTASCSWHSSFPEVYYLTTMLKFHIYHCHWRLSLNVNKKHQPHLLTLNACVYQSRMYYTNPCIKGTLSRLIITWSLI